MWKTLCALCLLSINSVNAQHLSAGGKVGVNSFVSVGSGITKDKLTPVDGRSAGMAGELFARYTTKGRFAYEVGFGRASRTTRNTYDYPNYRRTDVVGHQYYLLNLSVNYDIRCKQWREHKYWNKLAVYIGLGVTGGLNQQHYGYQEFYLGGWPGSSAFNRGEFVKVGIRNAYGVMVLFNQSIVYNLGTGFNVIASADLKTMPWLWNNKGFTNGMSAIQVGVSYNIY